MEDGAFANAAIDQDRVLRSVARENIRFHGDEQLLRRVGKGGENRLAADDDELGRVGVAGGSADDVFKLRPIHELENRG